MTDWIIIFLLFLIYVKGSTIEMAIIGVFQKIARLFK